MPDTLSFAPSTLHFHARECRRHAFCRDMGLEDLTMVRTAFGSRRLDEVDQFLTQTRRAAHGRRTGFVTPDRLVQRLHANTGELLMVLALGHLEAGMLFSEPLVCSGMSGVIASVAEPTAASPSGIVLAPGSAAAAVLPSRSSFQTSSGAADSLTDAAAPGLMPRLQNAR